MAEYKHMTVERMGEMRKWVEGTSATYKDGSARIGAALLTEALNEIDALRAEMKVLEAEVYLWERRAEQLGYVS